MELFLPVAEGMCRIEDRMAGVMATAAFLVLDKRAREGAAAGFGASVTAARGPHEMPEYDRDRFPLNTSLGQPGTVPHANGYDVDGGR